MTGSINLPFQALTRINELVERNYEVILEGTVSKDITRFFNGKHRKVFELQEFPHHVVKIDKIASEKILIAIQKGHDVIKTLGLSRIHVPNIIKLPFKEGLILWIEDKLDGIYDAEEAQEKSEIAFNSNQEKWVELFDQAAQFIIATGYDDVDWRNLLLMKDGLGFIDFERISSSPVITASGLLRLMEISPDYCIDPILELAKKNGLDKELFFYAHHSDPTYNELLRFDDKLNYFRNKRHSELERNKAVRVFHNTLAIEDRTPIAINEFPEGTMERRIVNEFNTTLSDNYHQNIYRSNKLKLRKIDRWQPFQGLQDSQIEEAMAEVDQALNNLKQKKVIFDFSKGNIAYKNCIWYNVQF